MIPRKRLDLGWRDLLAGVAACFSPTPAEEQARRVEHLWSRDGHALAALSVRSGFDALLAVLALPPGSEVLVSAVTIRDMARILEAHGLVPVPLDLDMHRLEVPAGAIGRLAGPRTKAVLLAHLFGSRMPMQGLIDEAKRLGLLVIEDCAQAYTGDSYRGHPGSDVAMFSFGTIKTATALGGALLRFRDPALRSLVRQHQTCWPRQPRSGFLRRCLKYAGLMAISTPPIYGWFVAACRMADADHDRIIAASVRGFAGPDFFARLRVQPSAPLLALMGRRIAQRIAPRVARRAALGAYAASALRALARPGDTAAGHTHWVFPVLHDDPQGLMRHLWSQGFDATRGASSLYVVEAPQGDRDAVAAEAERAFQRLLYLPFDARMTEADCDRMASVIASYAAVTEAAPARAGLEPASRSGG
jgi:perosamine synthetase